MHIQALRAMGAKIEIENGYIVAECKKLKGTTINFQQSSVTGTENILMAACLADGKTKIINAAREPEVVDLSHFLIKMGAKIKGHGTENIDIEGVTKLNGTEYSVLPDRIETGTFLVAGAITGGKIKIKNTVSSHVEIIIEKLKEAGAEVNFTENTIELDMKGKRPKPVNIETGPYPYFPTDMQAQITALNAIASGNS